MLEERRSAWREVEGAGKVSWLTERLAEAAPPFDSLR